MNDFFKNDHEFDGTKGLVFVGDEIIIYRRDSNTTLFPFFLDVPGGVRESSETPFETFKREVKEEFGLELQAEHITYSRRYTNNIEPPVFTWFAVAKLPIEFKHRIQFGDEGINYTLMSIEEFLKCKDAIPIHQERTVDYIKSLNT